MTEQQANSPIDDLFRKTLENLPDTPAESGWDTPSDRVWQHVQANMTQHNSGWSTKSLVLLTAILITIFGGLYWMFSGPAKTPTVAPSVAPIEQPVLAPVAPTEQVGNQNIEAPKSSTGSNAVKETSPKPKPRNSTEENQAKPNVNGAQPLPGSKQTLPPNSTEAQKKKGEGN
jgi:hypothetical protein